MAWQSDTRVSMKNLSLKTWSKMCSLYAIVSARPCERLTFKCVLYCGTSVLIYAFKILNTEFDIELVVIDKSVWGVCVLEVHSNRIYSKFTV